MQPNEEQRKEIEKLMKKYYDEDGNLTEEGQAMVREDYKLAGEFEMELTGLCNKYVNKLNPQLFGFVWSKAEDGIKLVHALKSMPPPGSPPPGNIFG